MRPIAGFIFRLRAACLFAVMVLSLIVFIPCLISRWRTPLAARYRFSTSWMRFFIGCLRLLVGIEHRVEGLERLPTGAVIYFSKHQSTWETLVFQTLFPHYVWILKKEAMRIPLFGWGLATLEPIAIDRSAGKNAVAQIKEQGVARLAAGQSILIFPQGTRVAPGQRRPYKIGGGVLAAVAAAPVVPIAHNAGLYWPPKRLLVARPGTIRVRVGEAFDTAGMTPHQIIARVEEWVERNTTELEAAADPPAASANPPG